MRAARDHRGLGIETGRMLQARQVEKPDVVGHVDVLSPGVRRHQRARRDLGCLLEEKADCEPVYKTFKRRF